MREIIERKPSRHFTIRTLSDYTNLGQLEFISAALGLLGMIFPDWGLFRRRLTMSDLNQIFPGSGYWTVKYKNYLLAHISYLDDKFEENVRHQTDNFVWSTFRPVYCMDVPVSCWTLVGQDWTHCDVCYSRLNQTLADEATGKSTTGAAGFNLSSLTPILLVGAGVYLVSTLSKKKSRR